MKPTRLFYIALSVTLLLASSCRSTPKADSQSAADAEAENRLIAQDTTLQHATFAMGCFWHSEEIFSEIKGVKEALPGYSGGTEPNPSYEQVGTGTTRYAESVEVTFDPKEITYEKLLEVFFAEHDPTTKDYQDPDEGPQYRSAVFYHDAPQKDAIQLYITKLTESHKYRNPIVTEVAPFTKFYKAEDYHIHYYRLHPDQGYIAHVTKPEVEKFRRDYPGLVNR